MTGKKINFVFPDDLDDLEKLKAHLAEVEQEKQNDEEE